MLEGRLPSSNTTAYKSTQRNSASQHTNAHHISSPCSVPSVVVVELVVVVVVVVLQVTSLEWSPYAVTATHRCQVGNGHEMVMLVYCVLSICTFLHSKLPNKGLALKLNRSAKYQQSRRRRKSDIRHCAHQPSSPASPRNRRAPNST